MKSNLISIIVLLCTFAAGMSSCCKYAKVPYRSCECKDYYAEIEDWFYYDKEIGKNFINPEKKIPKAIDFLRSGIKCKKDLNSKQLVKIFGGHPDRENEKHRSIVFRFLAHEIDPKSKTKYYNPPITIAITYDVPIEEPVLEQLDAADGYYMYTFRYRTEK